MRNSLVVAQEAPPGDAALVDLVMDPEFGQGGALDQVLVSRSIEAKQRLFDGLVEPIAPLYVSSYCREHCTYCNYRAGNKAQGIVRKRLSDNELRREVAYLAEEKGLRFIELVYASDPHLRHGDMARHVAIVRETLEGYGGGKVGLSAEPLTADEYRALRDAGLDLCVLWMETYDQEQYRATHPGLGAKSNQQNRIEAYQRMLQAGIPEIGMGVLSGLGPWRQDWYALMQHELLLRQRYGRGAAVLGIPRMQPAAGALRTESPYRPNDRQFRALIALHNLFAPDCRPFISTREEFEFCVELAQGGGCLFTFNCSTIPGGYTLGSQGYQFRTGDYDAPLFRPLLEQAQLRVLDY